MKLQNLFISILIIMCICFSMVTPAFADEISTTEPTIIETLENEETTATEIIEEVTDEVTEDESTLDILKRIETLLIAIQFTGVFAIMIHYSEKWLKGMIEGIKNSGRVK